MAFHDSLLSNGEGLLLPAAPLDVRLLFADSGKGVLRGEVPLDRHALGAVVIHIGQANLVATEEPTLLPDHRALLVAILPSRSTGATVR